MWAQSLRFLGALLRGGQLVAIPFRAAIGLARLAVFCALAWPPFAAGLLRHTFDTRVRRVKLTNTAYADVFSPYWNLSEPRNPPVVILLPGGAWTFQNTAYDLYIAEQLLESGAIVVSVQIGNLPGTDIPEMVNGLGVWLPELRKKSALAGAGAESEYILIGTSSGAHVAVTHALRAAKSGDKAWVDRMVLISFPADLRQLTTFAASTVYHLFFRAFPASAYSPMQLLQSLDGEAARRIVPMMFIHGDADTITPLRPVVDFSRLLAEAHGGEESAATAGERHDCRRAPPLGETTDAEGQYPAALIVLAGKKHADFTLDTIVRGSGPPAFDLARLLTQRLPASYALQQDWLSRAPCLLPRWISGAAMAVFPF